MPKPYDVTLKSLIESHPLDWLRWIGLPIGTVDIIDADLSAIIAEADKLLRVNTEQPYIAHIEMQASYKPDMADRFMRYNMLAGIRTELPVDTTVFLLCPVADGTVMRQPVMKRFMGGEPYLQFHFRVVRLWQEPVEAFLEGGLGMLPLAPLCAVSKQELPEVVRRMEKRIETESEDAGTAWLATYLLMGLRYEQAMIQRLLRGVSKMRESVTYQAILEEGEAIGEARGEARGERNLLLLLGRKRLGEPNAKTLEVLQSIMQPEILERLAIRLLEVETWNELLTAL
ncbi:hypothetical protein LBMAG21_15710 [Armatimonadota bacterium]|nr:hypothetical protein LBMAG21_15710 [Armatimonadota bacterium]